MHPITNYPGYQTDGVNVYSKATGKPVSIKKGTGKYYLLNKHGERKLLDPVQALYISKDASYEVGNFVPEGEVVRHTYRKEKKYAKIKTGTGYTFKRIP